MVHGSPWRGNAATEPVRSLTPTGSVNDVESDEGGSKGKRPLGRDSTKTARKKATSSSSQSTDYLARLHDIQIARLKQSEEKSELKQQNIEFMKEVELKKLEVQSKENRSAGKKVDDGRQEAKGRRAEETLCYGYGCFTRRVESCIHR
jgi:hypothetical protein